MSFLPYFVVLIILSSTKAAVIPIDDEKTTTCGYEACAKVDPEKLNIHIVPHSHDDVGWLKTVNQYYFGTRNDIQPASVQNILNSVIKSLQKSPDRRFIYVESAFFFKWWDRQSESKQAVVQALINEGRLEIIGGGWSMNDEAVTHYQSTIDQFSWGFRRLNDSLGKCARPKIGWQIDPFGHSREQASIFAQMGFDGLLFGRLDYEDKIKRMKTKTLEFIWRGSPSLGENANLFTSVLYNRYDAPPTFCFDILCADEPLVDDPESPDYNMDRRVGQFLEFVDNQAKDYRTNNVILTMGADFTYQFAEPWYTNLDKLIKFINLKKGSTYNAIYSTPSCYLKAVNEQNLLWSTKSDDFFPYASDANSYWTGYYTSRPTIKFYERMGNNFLQVIKQLSVLSNEPETAELRKFREVMGVLQHHDAVTGTEKEHVAHDYARMLSKSIKNGQIIGSKTLRKMVLDGKRSENTDPLEFYSCPLLNISSCEYTENKKNFVVTVYNPTSQPLRTFVRLPVTGRCYRVKDYEGKEVLTQSVPISSAIKGIPGRKSSAKSELVFLATGIPPLGYLSYYVSKKNKHHMNKATDSTLNRNDHATNKTYCIHADANGRVLIHSHLDESFVLRQSFHYYEGAEGNNLESLNRTSGAYIFRPRTTGLMYFNYTGYFQIFRGPLVDELRITVNDWISQIVRVYTGEDRLEFNWLVGPIDISDETGKEIITRYTTTIKSNGEFSTDSNGREMLRRIRNKRPTWDVTLEEPIAGNYYPVTTKISLTDEKRNLKMSVLTDRAQGGTSLNDGEIELMIHRRLLGDDDFGVGEALNETAYGMGLVARGKHSLIIGPNSDSFVLQEKNEAVKLSLRPWIFITPVKDISYDEWNKSYKMRSSGLARALPPNVHILTLEPWKDGSVLLRLEHLFESDESDEFSKPVTINIKDLFSGFSITSVRETTLGGNQWLEDNERLKWFSDLDSVAANNYTVKPVERKDEDEMNVLLMPMQIRTFIVDVASYDSDTVPESNTESN